MNDRLKPELRELAVKIATSYARSNTVTVEALPSVIVMAYQALEACIAPPPPPPAETPKRGRRGGKGVAKAAVRGRGKSAGRQSVS
jgi:predicted transcriptional regulator